MTPHQQTDGVSRRRVLGLTAGALAVGGLAIEPVAAGAENNPAMPGRIYADGEMFATRGLTDLPPPTEDNEHSFDVIYHFTNGAEGQLDVGEAAPGDRDFNGGRWAVTVLEWTIQDPPVVTSHEAVHMHWDDIDVVQVGARYFECPLVPLRG